MEKIIPVLEKYLLKLTNDEFHRYLSWDHCFTAFESKFKTDSHALELAFYLASWGMYRGSSGLLQKNHRVHIAAVDLIFSKPIYNLRCTKDFEVSPENLNTILAAKKTLSDYYSKLPFSKFDSKSNYISTTDTLISKIMLGTLGCVPAYDRYFLSGLSSAGLSHRKFDKKSLNELLAFINKNGEELSFIQKDIWIRTSRHYPMMKLIDMYFWQIGYDLENEKRR